MLLAIVATLGFGLLQGALLLDGNTGPYSPSPYARLDLESLSTGDFALLLPAFTRKPRDATRRREGDM